MKRAFVFPGQGSQAVGMGKALADGFEEAREVFGEVDEALKQKLTTLMFEGPESDLVLTENAQPALMAVSMAVVKILEKQGGKTVADCAAMVAGHSLGEYSALTAAGTLEIADCARLLKRRGQAMQQAVPVGEGAMAAILGVDLAVVEEIVAEAATASSGVCELANDNSTGQIVVSGKKEAVEKAVEIAAGKGGKRSVLLPVSAPFHCALMAPAADAMAEALADVSMKAPVVPVMANVTASLVSDPEEIRKLLVQQVTGRVRWRESVLQMKEEGVEELVELGAGKVLSGLVRRIDKAVKGRNAGTPEEIEALIEAL